MMKLPLDEMRQEFGERLEEGAPLARFTSARLGGPADALITAHTKAELIQTISWLWERELPSMVLGGGSNVLISDRGVREVVVLNRARRIQFETGDQMPGVWAESGANFGLIARQSVNYGLSGLEWAVGIPGTLGGAVVGNAGAHGDDMANCLVMAEILHHDQQEIGCSEWSVEKLGYVYRNSLLKQRPGQYVVLAAKLRLEKSIPSAVQEKMDAFTAKRQRTQPPGATMGSMFKNPSGDYAGRLIEAAGLKGTNVGDAVISPRHGNFFINRGQATATDFSDLIELAQSVVLEKFGIFLELEIEKIGDWQVE